MRRLFIKLAIILMAVLAVGAVSVLLAIRETTVRTFQNNPSSYAFIVAELAQQANSMMNVEQYTKFFEEIAKNNIDYELVNENNELYFTPEIVTELSGGLPVWIKGYQWPDGKSPGGIAIHLGGTEKSLLIRPTHPISPPMSGWIASIMIFCVVIIVAGLTFLVPIVRRLNELELKATQIAAGNYEVPDDVSYPKDSIGYLAQAMDDMSMQIQSAMDKQSHMIMAIAHELRTPISRIQFGLEMLSMTADANKRALRKKAIDGDIAELDQMVAELLTYSRYDSHQETHQGEVVEVSLPDCLSALKERLNYSKPNTLINIEYPENEQKSVYLTLHPFNRVLSNLVGNALRYARSQIVISYHVESDDMLVVHVDDDGNGVPPEERLRVFEPFTRLEKSRERDKGGVGLGLAIVAQIMRTVGGSVVIEDAPIGGARFTLHWPIGKRQG